MFWNSGGGEAFRERDEEVEEARSGPIEIERDAQRPATILHVASELEARGAKILELFKEISSPRGEAVLPIHLYQDEQEFLIEVETGPWEPQTVEAALATAVVVRGSDHAEVRLEILSAYPVPREVSFLFGRSPAALLQLELLEGRLERPEAFAETFREAASRHWGIDLDYSPEGLPLAEELLLAALDGEGDESSPVLDALVEGLGCYLGEVIRRNAEDSSSWRASTDWGDGLVLEFRHFSLDPIGKARAFLHAGPEDSVAYYADYALRQVNGASEDG